MVVGKGKRLIKMKHTTLLFTLWQPQLHSAVAEIFLHHLFIHNNRFLPIRNGLRQMPNKKFPLQHPDDGHYRNSCALLRITVSQHYCTMLYLSVTCTQSISGSYFQEAMLAH